MNDDIKEFGVVGLTHRGELVSIPVFSTDGYNHKTHHLHHFIKQQDWKRDKEWFIERGIKQKLILLPQWLHLIVHNSPAGARVSDADFEDKFKISRWELIFNRRHSKY